MNLGNVGRQMPRTYLLHTHAHARARKNQAITSSNHTGSEGGQLHRCFLKIKAEITMGGPCQGRERFEADGDGLINVLANSNTQTRTRHTLVYVSNADVLPNTTVKLKSDAKQLLQRVPKATSSKGK